MPSFLVILHRSHRLYSCLKHTVNLSVLLKGPLSITGSLSLSVTSSISGHWSPISVCVRERKEAIVWRAQPPLSGCHQNGSTSSFSSLELMPQWLYNPPPAAFFCSTWMFGADIPSHHWSSRRTNGNPPACWNYWWLSSSPQSSQCHFYLLPLLSPFSYASVSFSHPPLTRLPSDCSLFSAEGLRIYAVLQFILFPVSLHPTVERAGIRYGATANAMCLKVSRMITKRW